MPGSGLIGTAFSARHVFRLTRTAIARLAVVNRDAEAADGDHLLEVAQVGNELAIRGTWV